MRKMARLMAVINGILELLQIQCLPLASAHAPSIRQRGWTICPVPGQPAVSARETHRFWVTSSARLRPCSQVLGHETEKAVLRQTGIRRTMYLCVMSRLVNRTSTRSGLTPSLSLNILLWKNK